MSVKAILWSLLVLIATVAVLWLSAPFASLDISDCTCYMRGAYTLATTHQVAHDFFAERLSVIVPYALYYYVAGSEIVTAGIIQVTRLELVALVMLIFLMLYSLDRWVALIAALLIAWSPIVLVSAHTVDGDIMTALLLSVPVLCLARIHAAALMTVGRQQWLGAISALCWVAAILAKESALLFLPAFIFLLVYYRRMPFWWAFMGVSALCAIAYMYWYYLRYADPLHRIADVYSNVSGISNPDVTLRDQLLRITIYPFVFLAEDFSFGTGLLCTVLGLCATGAARDSVARFFRLTTLWVLAAFVLYPNTMSLAHRLWLPVLILLAINAGYTVRALYAGQIPARRVVMVSLGFLLLAGGSLWWSGMRHTQAGVPQHFALVFIAYVVLVVVLLCYLYRPAWSAMALGAALLAAALAGTAVKARELGRTYSAADSFLQEQQLIRSVAAAPLLIIDPQASGNIGIFAPVGSRTTDFHKLQSTDSVPSGTVIIINQQRLSRLKNQVSQTVVFCSNPIPLAAYAFAPEQYGFTRLSATPDSNCIAYIKR